ncbi:NUDIX domain-containing protein [Candidatus Woesearchaeota archaeon]|nr:NUDIX domain-containing protein [Candidatus Woesearchaeota archaeon]
MDSEKAHYIVATCIVVRDGKFLIAKRSEQEKRWSGRWTVPGGKLEKGEYKRRPKDTKEGHWYNVFENLVKREVKEEVGLDIKNIRYLTSLAFEREDGVPTLIVSLYAYNDGDEIVLSDELSDYKWVNLEEAKNYDLIEGIYEELEMLDRVLKGEETIEWSKLD